MKFFRIRHKPSQLFYQPVKGRFRGEKTNFGPNGKLYHTRPSFKYLSNNLNVSDSLYERYDCFLCAQRCRDGKELPFIQDDWEIVEYELKEIE